MANNIEIMKATPTHLDFIAEAQRAMALETENMHLDSTTVKQGVAHIFDHPATGFYLIATVNAIPVGCMLVLYEWSDWRNGNVLWIHSLYVMPHYRKNGIFGLFYQYLKNRVNSGEYRGVRLYVDKTNLTAQQCYQKMGMSREHYDLYEWMP